MWESVQFSSLGVIVSSCLSVETNLFFNHHLRKLMIKAQDFFPYFISFPVAWNMRIRILAWSYQSMWWMTELGMIIPMMSSFPSPTHTASNYLIYITLIYLSPLPKMMTKLIILTSENFILILLLLLSPT